MPRETHKIRVPIADARQSLLVARHPEVIRVGSRQIDPAAKYVQVMAQKDKQIAAAAETIFSAPVAPAAAPEGRGLATEGLFGSLAQPMWSSGRCGART